MPEAKTEKRQPHFISTKLLDALGGIRKTEKVNDKQIPLVDRGAYLWGVENQDLGKGILNHVLLCSRVACCLGRELKSREINGYKDINLEYVVHAALLHDSGKLYGEDREKLLPEIKEALGIPRGFRESSPEVDQVVSSWLQDFEFPPQVYEAINRLSFPEKIIDNPYWKITLLSDYMVGQEVMTVEERLKDVRTRWIDQRVENNLEPRIEPERFEMAARNIRVVAEEIFEALEMSDRQFIEKYKLNSDESQTRWEKFLKNRGADKEKRAKGLVKALIG